MTRQITVSIVDDEESLREALMALMQSCGYASAAFESGASFLADDHAGRTDCLIADMHMPGMTGLELLDRLAARGHRIPTILITGRHDEALKARALQAGVQCYLAKPFSDDALLRCIRSAVNHGRAEAP